MSGYTPVFRSIFEGTLCGQYPDTAAWLFLLALADRNGEVDKTPQYISAVTGMPVEDLTSCIERFMQPDPSSRSPDEDGRRLVLIDETRNWGWRIVNHERYREKARLAAKSAREVEEGKNRERMKERTAADRRSPPPTAADPLSNSNANTEQEGAPAPRSRKSRGAAKPSRRVPEEFSPDLEYARQQLPDIDAEREARKFRDWEFRTPRKDWAAAWRNWVDNCRDNGRYAKATGERWI